MRLKTKRNLMVAGAGVFALSIAAFSSYAAEVRFSLVRQLTSAPFWNEGTEKQAEAVSVVTREDIDASNAKQTTDILGALPGIFIRKTGDFGRADVDIRGIGDGGRQLGIFIDGRPDKMGLFGCSVTHTLPLNNVERIEVIRGPESVLYGSEAFGGVVNVITRKASKSFEGSLLASYGTDNTQEYRLQNGGKHGKFDYFVAADKRISDGNLPNSQYDAMDYSTQFGYVLTPDSEISLSAKYFTGTKHEPSPATVAWNDYDRGALDLTYKLNAGIFQNSVKVYRSYGEHKFADGFHSKDHTDGAMLNSKAALAENNALTFGLDTRYQYADVLHTSPASMVRDYHKYEYGLYASDEHALSEKLTLNGGLRYNRDQFAGEVWVPRAGAVYKALEGTTLRGVWSKGFRAPQLNDLYLWAGNKDLKPEKVTNTEFGLRQKLAEPVALDVAWFVMKGSDLIEARSGKKRNIGDFEFKGAEAMLTAKLSDSLNGQVNYTWFDPGSRTTGRPKDKAGASLKYAEGRVSAALSGTYVGRYFAGDNSTARLKNYCLLDLKTDYKLSGSLSVFAAADNITDKRYQVYYDAAYTMPGRTVTGGVNYAF